MSVLSAASTTYITRKAIVKLRQAVLFECNVEVKRDGKIEVKLFSVIRLLTFAHLINFKAIN